MLTYKLTDNVLNILLPNCINSDNAEEIEQEINNICGENTFDKLIFDGEKLEYISSRGLRIILHNKKLYEDVVVINVSLEVYEIFTLTGFDKIMEVSKRLREVSIEGCKLIGSGQNGDVYRIDKENIIKVYKKGCGIDDINRERELAKVAFVTGVPTALSFDVVKVGDGYGTLYELLEAESMAHYIAANPDKMEEEVDSFISLVKEIHGLKVDSAIVADKKAEFLEWASDIKEQFDADTNERIMSMIQAIPDSDCVIHGDIHFGNIMKTKDELSVIDTETIGFGDPVIEFAHLYCALIGFSFVYESDNLLGFNSELYPRIWARVVEEYYGDIPKADREEKERIIEILAMVRLCRYAMRHKNVADKLDILRDKLLDLLGR